MVRRPDTLLKFHVISIAIEPGGEQGRGIFRGVWWSPPGTPFATDPVRVQGVLSTLALALQRMEVQTASDAQNGLCCLSISTQGRVLLCTMAQP